MTTLAAASDLLETAFGLRKRLDYATALIRGQAPRSALDIGCGTGAQLTTRLAQMFPGVQFVGVDDDAVSIQWANDQHQPANVRFMVPAELPADQRFDLVFASEVIEHVEDPGGFLLWLAGRLNPGGRIFVTLPNGYGPYELITLAHQVLARLGLIHGLKRVLGRVGVAPCAVETLDTLAASPHINFFSFANINRVIAGSGLMVVDYRPRTFLCGWFLDRFVARHIQWNADVADHLPPALASDWMFVLAPAAGPL